MEIIENCLKQHKGKNNCVTANEISKKLKIIEDDTHAGTRAKIRKCIEERGLPVASNSNGYYWIVEESELDTYIKSLDGRIKGIEERKEIVKNNFGQNR